MLARSLSLYAFPSAFLCFRLTLTLLLLSLSRCRYLLSPIVRLLLPSPDLTLINAQSALGFLLIDENLAALGIDCGDLHSAMVHDKAAIVDVLSLHSHCPSVPIHLQIGFSDSVRLLPSHLKRSLGSYIPVLKLKQVSALCRPEPIRMMPLHAV